MIYTHIAAGLMGAAIAAAGAWQVQNWRYGEQIFEIRYKQVEAQSQAFGRALEKTKEFQRKKDEALNEATKRAQRNAAAAAVARVESDGLRDELARARSAVPSAACASVRGYATALTTVFDQCARTVEGLAGQADGHASDALMFEQAWPRN